MAKRPWVTPQEVRDYSVIPEVQQRTDARLEIDIARAEQYVIAYTHNSFEEIKKVPQSVKTAAIILAEAYGHKSSVLTKEVKSETFDDYSCTYETKEISAEVLGIEVLLQDYVKKEPKNGVILRMRKL